MIRLFRNDFSGTYLDVRLFLWFSFAITSAVLLSSCENEDQGMESVTAMRCDGGNCSDTGSMDADINSSIIDDTAASDADSDAQMYDPLYLEKFCDSDRYCKNFCPRGSSVCVFDDDKEEGKQTGYCECNCDSDGDTYFAVRCGGDDCNDLSARINPGQIEVCDYIGVDEDCNPETFMGPDEDPGAEDFDDDGFLSKKCLNIDPLTGKIHNDKNLDCNDTREDIHPGAVEVCDGVDNNCDGYTDESSNEKKHYGLRRTFYPDEDGDHWGSNKGEIMSCFGPSGYVERTEDEVFDCDDEDYTIYPNHPEICDGKDNDCDGQTDEIDKTVLLLFDQPTFVDTNVICLDGKWRIADCPKDRLDCNDLAEDGCETLDNRLSTCKACSTNCLFSCGEMGCDEIEMLSVGGFHVCTVTAERKAACWGRNSSGQLGNDSTNISLMPTPVFGISDVKRISAGEAHTCAIDGAENELFCWGSNEFGQLGLGFGSDISFIQIPFPTLGPAGFSEMSQTTSVAAGSQHTCAVFGEGSVACWGNQENGRLGNGSYDDHLEPIPQEVIGPDYSYITNGVQVVAGDSHSCVLTDDAKVMCWGDNTYGQLGGELEVQDIAQEVLELSDLLSDDEEILSLAAGRNHTCALISTGKLFCWGDNRSLQLGRPGRDETLPGEVLGISDIVAVAAGTFHTCALSAMNHLTCWGSNDYGERGDDEQAASDQPHIVDIGPTDRIAAGGGVSCARIESGQVACWGDNFFGQLGIDQYYRDFQPTPQTVCALRGSVR